MYCPIQQTDPDKYVWSHLSGAEGQNSLSPAIHGALGAAQRGFWAGACSALTHQHSQIRFPRAAVDLFIPSLRIAPIQVQHLSNMKTSCSAEWVSLSPFHTPLEIKYELTTPALYVQLWALLSAACFVWRHNSTYFSILWTCMTF